MIVTVNWQSTYRYSSAVRQVHNELRVVPAARDGQRRLSSSLTTDPPAAVVTLIDLFGNEYHYFDLLGELTSFSATMQATVDTAAEAVPDLQPSVLAQYLMLQPTERCPFDPRIEELFRAVSVSAEPLELADRVMNVISERFAFELGHTSVEATALDLLDLGRGVCQDFAHLMSAALRMRGVPARYVSGYLAPEDGEASADASHAWVQVYVDGAWHGFDPSGNQRQDERYVVCAVGRDYDDVPPLRGSYWGAAEHDWQSSVQLASGQQQQ